MLDILSTRTPEALYEAFEPDQACRLCERIGRHYTPKAAGVNRQFTTVDARAKLT